MPTFRMDQTNFVQGHRDGTRIVPLAGLRVDFNELAADSNTVGLWHLHDGGCQGEGTGLEDASGNGRPLSVSQGAPTPRDSGYEFVFAAEDRLAANLGSLPARANATWECWIERSNPSGTYGGYSVADTKDDSNRFVLIVRNYPAYYQITGILYIGAVAVGLVQWTGADAQTLITSGQRFHVAVVLEDAGGAASSFRLYVDGVLRAVDTTGLAPLPLGTFTLYVGNYVWGGQTFDGILDEVRVSSVARYAANFTPQRLRVSGTDVSPTFDTDRTQAVWKDLVAEQGLPSGTDVTWETRAADELDEFGDPLAEWGSYDGEPSSLPLGRWFQWRATLWSSPDRLATPTVESVEAQSSDVGYNLYHAMGPGPEVLNYVEPYAQVGPNVCSVNTTSLTPGAVHWFGVRPVDGRDIVSPTAQGEVRIELDGQGGRVPDRPAGVLALSVRLLPGGIARLDWRWRPGQGGVVPRAFRIFGDGGLGAIDYQTPLGEVAYRDARPQYAWESGELAGGLDHQLAVRAVAADEVWDEQPAVVRVTPDAEPPSRVDALQAEAIL